MAAKVKLEDSTPLEDGARRMAPRITHTIKHDPESAAAVAEHDLVLYDGMGELYIEIELRAPEDSGRSGANAHHAPGITRTIKREPESAAAAAEADLMSDDGMDEIEVKSEPIELDRAPDEINGSNEAVNICINCQTTASTIWISGKRWNLEGKLCWRCYRHRIKTAPKVIVHRQCADCGVDESTCKQWLSGRRWNVEWLCRLCYTYRYNHEGTARRGSVLSDTLLGNCHDCDLEEPERSEWRRGTRWGILGKLCGACYRWRARNDGKAKPRDTKFECAKCGSVDSTRWINGGLMGLQGFICTRCEYARTHPNATPRPKVRGDCSDCHIKAAGRWKSGTSWGIYGLLCRRCYDYRRNHNGQSRVLATVVTQDDERDAGEDEADETVPPPAKRQRTMRGNAAEAAT